MLGNIKDIIQLLLNLITDEKIIIILTSVSIISLVLSIFIIPYVIVNIPENYFISKRRMSTSYRNHAFNYKAAR